jgi:hypothetical protein
MGILHEDQHTFLSYLAHFFLEWGMFQRMVAEKIKTYILCSLIFFQKLYRLWDNVEKRCRAEEPTDDDMEQAHCMLYNYGYSHNQNM